VIEAPEYLQIAEAGQHPWMGIEVAPPRYGYAIIKHRWRISNPPLLNPPDTCPFQELSAGTSKGTPVSIPFVWFDYIKSITPDMQAYQWITAVGNMVFNTPNSPNLAQLLGCGGNYVVFDAETDTHVRAITMHYYDNVYQFDPLVDNWRVKPWLFWKACTIAQDGTVRNVGAGLDAYWGLIAKSEIWVAKQFLEIFPTNDGYYFENGVIMLSGRPYLHATKNVVMPQGL
jgi:hypothetical protein